MALRFLSWYGATKCPNSTAVRNGFFGSGARGLALSGGAAAMTDADAGGIAPDAEAAEAAAAAATAAATDGYRSASSSWCDSTSIVRSAKFEAAVGASAYLVARARACEAGGVIR